MDCRRSKWTMLWQLGLGWMWREVDPLDPSCGACTDRSWWMRGREGAEVRGREDSGMTVRFGGRETNYFFCCDFTRRRTFWGYPAWEFSAGTPKPSIPGAIVDLCLFSREKIHTSHLFLGRENLTLLNCQQWKGWVWPRPNSPPHIIPQGGNLKLRVVCTKSHPIWSSAESEVSWCLSLGFLHCMSWLKAQGGRVMN